MIRDTSILSKLWITLVWLVTGFFVLNVLAVIVAVVVSSFGTRWLGTWLPDAFTTRWYAATGPNSSLIKCFWSHSVSSLQW